MTMRDLWSETAKRTGGAQLHRIPEPAAPAVPDIGQYRVTIDDVRAMREIDPLLNTGAIIMLAAPLTEAVPITRPDGRPLFTMEPVDRSTDGSAAYPSGDTVDAFYACLGTEATTVPRLDHLEAGRAWAKAALVAVPHHDLAVWRREHEALRTLVADRLANSFGLPAAVAQQFAGAPVPARTLWHGEDAKRLDEKRRAAEEKAKAEAAEAVAVQVETQRPKTVRELGLVVFEVVRYRAGVPHGAEVWSGSLRQVLHSDESTIWLGYRAVPAVHAPAAWSRNGVRLLGADEIMPATATAALDADRAALEFLHQLRVESGLDFGAMTGPLRSEVPESAPALARQWAPAVLSPTPGLSWRLDWLCEVLVRALALRPDVALQVLLPALDVAFKALPHNEPIRIPEGAALVSDIRTGEVAPRTHREVKRYADSQLPSSEMRDVVAARLVQAVSRGEWLSCMEPLELPHREAPAETPKKKSR